MSRNTEKVKTLKELNLMDRFLFAEAMDDKEFAETILEIILGRETALKFLPQSEKELRGSPAKRSVRLDVMLVDQYDTHYDVETQKQNKHDLPQRSRYYQSQMDVKLLDPGILDYKQLAPVCLIMICGFDVGGKGAYCYTYRRRCDEFPEQVMDDGALWIFLNTRGKHPELVRPEIVELLHYMEKTTDEMCVRCSCQLIKKLHRRVAWLRENEEVNMRYRQQLEHENDIKREAREAGLAEGESVGRATGFAEGESVGRASGLAEGAVRMAQAFGLPRKAALQVLMERQGLSEAEAEDAIVKFWE